METTFISIHNLSPEANILYASDSIVDILGFQPSEVLGKSCFEYFHPDEIPFARRVHSRGIQMDKAASLHYARVMNRNGLWVGCECVFTIVHDVLVASTSIYRGDAKNQQRAVDAPVIRRIFASTPEDPRYHMLEHLSTKFRAPMPAAPQEPRAALILNRFTRSLTVMYATNEVSSILGVTADQLKDKSFYDCIQEGCWQEAVRCLESAKANDSIAYLRFRYRDSDPERQDEPNEPDEPDEDMRDASASSDSEDGGVELTSQPIDVDKGLGRKDNALGHAAAGTVKEVTNEARPSPLTGNMRDSSGESTDLEHDSFESIFDRRAQNSRSTTSTSSDRVVGQFNGREGSQPSRRPRPTPRPVAESHEIEAVVSCTSDGLVVVLRRAHPLVASPRQPAIVPELTNGLFAAPWGANPIRPYVHCVNREAPFRHGFQAPQLQVGGPAEADFMRSIREVAVFAWSLTGINGNIAAYGRGTPRGESLPPDGLPIWDPYAQPRPSHKAPENQAVNRWSKRMAADRDAMTFQNLRPEERIGYRNNRRSGPGLGSRGQSCVAAQYTGTQNQAGPMRRSLTASNGATPYARPIRWSATNTASISPQLLPQPSPTGGPNGEHRDW